MTALCSGKICTIFPEKGALNFWKACTIALEYSNVFVFINTIVVNAAITILTSLFFISLSSPLLIMNRVHILIYTLILSMRFQVFFA